MNATQHTTDLYIYIYVYATSANVPLKNKKLKNKKNRRDREMENKEELARRCRALGHPPRRKRGFIVAVSIVIAHRRAIKRR